MWLTTPVEYHRQSALRNCRSTPAGIIGGTLKSGESACAMAVAACRGRAFMQLLAVVFSAPLP